MRTKHALWPLVNAVAALAVLASSGCGPKRPPAVIAGGAGWGRVLLNAQSSIASGELRLLGYVPDEQLVALMARSAKIAMPVVSEPVPEVVGHAICGLTAPGTFCPAPIGALT